MWSITWNNTFASSFSSFLPLYLFKSPTGLIQPISYKLVMLLLNDSNHNISVCCFSVVNFQFGQQENFCSFPFGTCAKSVSLTSIPFLIFYSIFDPYSPQPQPVLLSWELGHHVWIIMVCYISDQFVSIFFIASSSSFWPLNTVAAQSSIPVLYLLSLDNLILTDFHFYSYIDDS